MHQFFVGLLVILASPFVIADWEILSNGNLQQPQQYINLQNVKQTGPMAIYRQVHVLSQGPYLDTSGVLSKLALYEYDCMNISFRLLRISGFNKPWAEGDAMSLPELKAPSEWLPLSLQALGQKIFDLLCQDGKEN